MAGKKKTAVRREQIAHAVLEIIGEGGLSALSTAAVAKRVGIVPSALYRHFAGLDEMLVAAIGAMAVQAQELFRQHAAGTDDPREHLRGIIKVHTELMQRARALPHILVGSAVERDNGSIRVALKDVQDGFIRMLGTVIKDGQARGVFRADIRSGDAALQFFGIVVMANIRQLAAGDEFDIEAYKAQACEIFLQGISAGPAGTQSGTGRD